MRNLSILALTLSNHFSPAPYFVKPPALSRGSLFFNHVHATRFLSSYLCATRFSSLRVTHSHFDTFLTSLPILRAVGDPGHLGKRCDDGDGPDGACRRVYRGQTDVEVTDTYFMNVNFTWASQGFLHPGTWADSVNPWDDTAEALDPFTGGCLRVVADTLFVEDCYFYSIRSDFYGSVISAYTRFSPVLSRLTIRSVSTLPEATGIDLLDTGPDGAMISLRGDRDGESDDVPLVFNSSILYDNDNVQPGQAMGGVAIWARWDIVIRALNLTQVNSPTSNGLLFRAHVADSGLSVAFCQFANCTNEAYGIIVLFYCTDVPVIELCNFLNQTVMWGLIPWMGSGGPAQTTTVTLRDSVFLVNGPVFYTIQKGSDGQRLVVQMARCVFSVPQSEFWNAVDLTDPPSITLYPQNVEFDAGLEASTRAPIEGELAKYVRPPLTITLAFTASSEFPPLSVHDTKSVFAFSTSLSAGVLATIFGILSLIVFLFLLYLRRGSAQTFKLIGRFNPDLEFDGAGRAMAYDQDAAEVEYTYSVSYEYYYDSEGKPDDE